MHVIHPIQMIDLDTAPSPVHPQPLGIGSRWAGLALAGLFVAGLAGGMSARGTEAISTPINSLATPDVSNSAPSVAGDPSVSGSAGAEGLLRYGGR
jgi:hypothetical protein